MIMWNTYTVLNVKRTENRNQSRDLVPCTFINQSLLLALHNLNNTFYRNNLTLENERYVLALSTM